MIIEREQINKAKEKLGDRNADIIAEMLNIQQYDPIKKRGLCHFHHEDTPSFIYNPKGYYFKCFGCNITCDIISAYMESGKTYMEAAEQLFKEADMPIALGEHHVKTKSQYKYPKQETNEDQTQVYDYWKLRCISQNTVDYVGVRQDNHGNSVFEYYDTNDVLTMVKYKPTHPIDKSKGQSKTWAQQGADTSPLLYNMNKVNAELPLLITEGEPDMLAAIESGYKNTVSVPFGSQNYSWIEENWDWLEQFPSIIIASDNDEAGIKMQKECIYRLGSWRTKVMVIPEYYEQENGTKSKVNDINELLFYGGKEAVLNGIINAKDTPVESLVDFSEIKEVDLSDIDGIYTGIQEFDQEMMRLFYGTFNILTGINGSGKSSFLSQLVAQSLDQSKDVWMYSAELPNYMLKNWQQYIFAGNRNITEYQTTKGSIYYKVNNDTKNQIDSYYKNRFFIYKDGWKRDIPSIQKSMVDSARKFGSKLFIIDNLTAINLECGDNEKWGKQVDFVNWLIDFAKKYHVVVMLVIHPKKIEAMRRLTKLDVAGLGSIVDLAHRLISLYRVSPKEKQGIKKMNGNGWIQEPIKYDVIMDVLKDRMRGREGLSIGLHYDVPSRRFFTNKEEYDHQYKFDTNVYTNSIPYPIPDESEVYGEITSEGA